MIKELKEFRCKCKQFPPYELLGFPSPPIVKAFFSKKCSGRGDMNSDSIDCYHDDDYKGQWAISGTKYRLSNENIIRDGGSTAL